MDEPKHLPAIWLDLKKVGALLREARQELNLSTRQLSAACGVSAAHISRMEGGAEAATGRLVKVASALGIPPGLVIERGLIAMAGARVPGERPALNVDKEIDRTVANLKSQGFITSDLLLLEAVDYLTVVAMQLLLSSNPQRLLEQMQLTSPVLHEALQRFVHLYGLETSSSERASVFRSLRKTQFAKLRALGLLTAPLLAEYIKQQGVSQNVPPQLTFSEIDATAEGMPHAPSAWLQLVERARQVTKQRGVKARLARDLSVTRQAVDKWLSGASAPSANLTLQLLNWVVTEEANRK